VRTTKRRMEAAGHKLDLVVIDYLQLVDPDEPKRSLVESVSAVSRGVKAMAMDEQVAVIALAQLSRAVEQRQDKRPVLSDLRESGQIEQDADAVVGLYRHEYYVEQEEPDGADADKHASWEARLERCRGIIEFLVRKRRNGPTGIARGRFFGPYQAVRSL
jgi:replicative DNA helicase